MFVKVSRSSVHGDGCFTTHEVEPGDVVARCRLFILTPEESAIVARTRLKDYVFYVKDGASEDPPYYTAIALGPVSFCNHSAEPNCDFSVDEAAQEVILVARRPLAANEEITIDYGDYAAEVIRPAA